MRMFVAAWPDVATQKRLSSLEPGPVQNLRPVPPGQWHITLRFLGDVGDDLVPALVDALGAAAANLANPIHCEVGPRTAWFGGERVLQLPVAGLDEAADAVRSMTLPLVPGSSQGETRFTGHLTIARWNGPRLNASPRDATAGVPFSASFDVDHFDLVASQATTEGHRYTTLARVPLPVRSDSALQPAPPSPARTVPLFPTTSTWERR
jgi:2'-5' RNA ligase